MPAPKDKAFYARKSERESIIQYIKQVASEYPNSTMERILNGIIARIERRDSQDRACAGE